MQRVRDWFDRSSLVALCVLRGGERVLWLGDVERPCIVNSVRKSLLGALYGIAVGRGEIDLGATLADLRVDDVPGLTGQERAATVADLLRSRSGVYLPVPPASDTASLTPSFGRRLHWLYEPRPPRGSSAPGARWLYNNWDFNVLGTVYEQLTGKSVFLAFERLIARPIGMRHFDPFEDGRYLHAEDYLGGTVRHPAYQFALSAHDQALFGQLVLHGGRWGASQVLPRTWVEESTRQASSTGLPGCFAGYGLLWWVGRGPGGHEVFTAYGARGHYIGVIPSLDTVLVTQSDNTGAGAISEDGYHDLVGLLTRELAPSTC